MQTGKTLASMLLLLAISFLPPGMSASWDAAELEAKGVLLRYFDALSQGDTITLRSLMAGNLLESRRLLLGNPLWPGYLGSEFGSAEFSVERTQATGPDEVSIDTRIVFAEDDYVVRRFVLRRQDGSAAVPSPFRVFEEYDPGLL